MKNRGLFFFGFLLLMLRVLMIFSIHPGNGPDEFGHMIVTTTLSQGKVTTLKEGLSYSTYPYAMYNPFAYLPSAGLLALASLKNPQLNHISKPTSGFSFESNYIARLGQCFWTVLYVCFLILLLKDDPFLVALFKGIALGLLPQIVFVQSYVNLDAMGLPIFLYLIWSTQKRNLNHIAFASFMIMNCKVNFICALALPVTCFFLWYRTQPRLLLKNTILYLGIPILLGCSWFAYNSFYNLKGLGVDGAGGLESLRSIFHIDHPPRGAVFSRNFLFTSLGSAFAAFGYMNQWLTPAIYKLFYVAVLLPSLLVLLGISPRFIEYSYKIIQKKEAGKRQQIWSFFLSQFDSIQVGMIAVLMLNFFIHYYAGYTTSYQPQGRYLFPAMIVALLYFAKLVEYLLNSLVKFRYVLVSATMAFFVLAFIVSCRVMVENPYKMGFGYKEPEVAQTSADTTIDSILGRAEILQPFRAKSNRIAVVEILFATYQQSLSGDCEFKILDEHGNSLVNKVVRLENVHDNNYLPIHMGKPIDVKVGAQYSLFLKPKENFHGNPFTIWSSKHVDSEFGSVRINGKKLEKTIAFKIYPQADEAPGLNWLWLQRSSQQTAGL